MADKKTIGLTAEGQKISDKVMSKGWFSNELTIARFAMSYAINSGVEKGEVHAMSTKWNRGSIDDDGGIRNTLLELYGEENEPYRLAEFLIDEGLKLMDKKMRENPNIDITSFLKN